MVSCSTIVCFMFVPAFIFAWQTGDIDKLNVQGWVSLYCAKFGLACVFGFILMISTVLCLRTTQHFYHHRAASRTCSSLTWECIWGRLSVQLLNSLGSTSVSSVLPHLQPLKVTPHCEVRQTRLRPQDKSQK